MSIDKAEVLRYLGHRGQAYGDRLDTLIDTAIETCRRLARPGRIFRLFDLEHATRGIRLAGTELELPGESIAAHLQGAQKAALLAATLGVEVEAEIRRLERVDITASLALDAAATECIEKYCDSIDSEIAAEAAALGLHAGSRFSPGYGDLPLALQPAVLRVLDTARRIGLTCTESLILLPRKSVTAVVGLFAAPRQGPRPGCAACNLRDVCDFRRCGVE